ncbi:Putative transmembrane protein [Sarcoptes scabiei]|uniref:Putative transmembrane protein n=1 Tax=Sarcoptes scabiei TaxID=52283 RepID=A0A834V8S6_SARSC|nr:Putative transmembrane protein [Sarcoptes scabiei]
MLSSNVLHCCNNNQIRIKSPRTRSLKNILKHNHHGKCLFLSLLIVVVLITLVWCRKDYFAQILIKLNIFNQNECFSHSCDGPECDPFFQQFTLISLIFLYILYVIECFQSTTRNVLRNGIATSKIYEILNQICQSNLLIWWKAVSYHFVQINQPIVCRKDYNQQDGTNRIVTRLRSIRKRIVTNQQSQCFHYRSEQLEDVSDILVDLEQYPITEIHFEIGYVFADSIIADEFRRQRTSFIGENSHRDRFLKIIEGFNLVGFDLDSDRMLSLSQRPLHRHWYCRSMIFWFFSLLLLSWPYRIILEINTAQVNCRIIKSFRNDPNSMVSNSMSENISLILNEPISDNYLLVPTYSEAVCLNKLLDKSDENGSTINPVVMKFVNDSNRKFPDVDDCEIFLDRSPSIEVIDSKNQSFSKNNLTAFLANLLPKSDFNERLKKSLTIANFDLKVENQFNFLNDWNSLQNVVDL